MFPPTTVDADDSDFHLSMTPCTRKDNQVTAGNGFGTQKSLTYLDTNGKLKGPYKSLYPDVFMSRLDEGEKKIVTKRIFAGEAHCGNDLTFLVFLMILVLYGIGLSDTEHCNSLFACLATVVTSLVRITCIENKMIQC